MPKKAPNRQFCSPRLGIELTQLPILDDQPCEPFSIQKLIPQNEWEGDMTSRGRLGSTFSFFLKSREESRFPHPSKKEYQETFPRSSILDSLMD
jgi:hypothetical protein